MDKKMIVTFQECSNSIFVWGILGNEDMSSGYFWILNLEKVKTIKFRTWHLNVEYKTNM